ncbi:two-component response regulator [Candidatus Moduliflexus flocculans]|uniref:Two-component response regulator n=1 Tax=Candidatus Moduliflexus flocculans TaxID=1499966 RepID=A0A0S6VR41_9BACT|nr:two-component response regulator [Candidatus Moduliflexus flocculans]
MLRQAILCVDDEPIILQSLRDQLEHHFGDQYLYEFAESVDEAFEILAELHQIEFQILLIVSDWLMPDMKGDEFLLQVHRRFPDIALIMLTGQADDTAIARLQESARLTACLRKPWTEQELIRVVTLGLMS